MKKTTMVYVSASLGLFLFGISLITLGSVAAPLQQKFQLDNLAAGTLFSILPLGILLGSLVFGPLSDRYGYKIIFLASVVCMFMGFQGIAYANEMGLLKVCILAFGFGGGMLNGASNAAVADISSESKGANISLVGFFFTIGALGMPFLMGILENAFGFVAIISSIGYTALLIGIVFIFSRFPEPKQAQGIPVSMSLGLLKQGALLLIGGFLFCQSSFEGIINNWTTTYLTEKLSIPTDIALYALSAYIAGMAVMRILVGTALRKVSPRTILFVSFGLLLAGNLLLRISSSYSVSVAGLVITGAGLASGFPIMLGFVGELYSALSATAFSLVFTIALLGNMLVNFLMGIVAENYGIEHLETMALGLLAVMVTLSLFILRTTTVTKQTEDYARKTMA